MNGSLPSFPWVVYNAFERGDPLLGLGVTSGDGDLRLGTDTRAVSARVALNVDKVDDGRVRKHSVVPQTDDDVVEVGQHSRSGRKREEEGTHTTVRVVDPGVPSLHLTRAWKSAPRAMWLKRNCRICGMSECKMLARWAESLSECRRGRTVSDSSFRRPMIFFVNPELT